MTLAPAERRSILPDRINNSTLAAFVRSVPGVDEVGAVERVAALSTRSIKRDSKAHALRLAVRMMDLTTLEGKDTPGKVAQMSAKAVRSDPTDPSVPSVAAVCVYPAMVPYALEAVAGSSVKVASVATYFPSGQLDTKLKVAETARVVEMGAHEVDMVIDRGVFPECAHFVDHRKVERAAGLQCGKSVQARRMGVDQVDVLAAGDFADARHQCANDVPLIDERQAGERPGACTVKAQAVDRFLSRHRAVPHPPGPHRPGCCPPSRSAAAGSLFVFRRRDVSRAPTDRALRFEDRARAERVAAVKRNRVVEYVEDLHAGLMAVFGIGAPGASNWSTTLRFAAQL